MTDEQRSDLARCLVHVGMAGLARCCAYMKAGEIEARINWELGRASFRGQPDKWFQLESAKNVARRIRKPMNGPDDYTQERDNCLGTGKWVIRDLQRAGYL